MFRGLLGKTYVHIILIAALGLIVYSNTFNVPFQWDDHAFIEENSLIKDLDNFLDISRVIKLEQLKRRWTGYLSFALNYRLQGLDVAGYHVINLSIHLINAALVYFLVIFTFRTPFLNNSSLSGHSRYMALFTGLFFVSHPIQTMAVTYIFQRLASLAAFFYLLSLVLYIKWRLIPLYSPLILRGIEGGGLYLLSLFSAVLAMHTKENAFTLPLTLTLYELFFFAGPKKKRIPYLVPYLLTLLIIPLTLIASDGTGGEIASRIDTATKGDRFSRADYFFTEFRVIVTYVRLLFFPINQNIDYDYPVFSSLLNPQVLLSVFFLLTVFCFSLYLLCRSREGEHGLRLVSFGMSWFFITLSVESSIIPLPRLIQEYRVYLPSVGFFIAVAATAFHLIKRRPITQTAVFIIMTLTIIAFSVAAYSRNKIWGSEISLWTDTVRKSPMSPGGHMELGLLYQSMGMIDNSIEYYRHALSLRPDFADAHYNLGIAYLEKGLVEEARKEFKVALQINPSLEKARWYLKGLQVSL